MLQLFTGSGSSAHRADGHPERPERLDAALAGLEAWGGAMERHDARAPATGEVLRLVHSAEHIGNVASASRNAAWIDADTYTARESDHTARVAVACTIGAAESAAEGRPSLALVRPPGHHATPDRAMGFCLYNNVAIAAASLAAQGKRVAIIDVDVHHGNGTQDAFYDRDDVLYVSLHQYPHYPMTGRIDETGEGEGVGHTLNLPLPAGTGHEGWLEAYEGAVMPVVSQYGPDVLLISVGFDAHARDPLASLRLVAQTYHAAVARARTITPRIAVALEGGYDLRAIRDGMHNIAAALAGDPCAVEEPVPEGERPWVGMRAEVLGAHDDRWTFA